jgi:hypothetical protein
MGLKLLRYLHAGARLQQRRHSGMELIYIHPVEYAAALKAVKCIEASLND